MATITATGKIIGGNYIGAPKRSCKPIDVPTKIRGTVSIDGVEYERTVHERVIWRNMGTSTTKARFVIVNGTNHEVEVN